MKNARFAKLITDRKINLIFNLIGMYKKARSWNRKNIDNYVTPKKWNKLLKEKNVKIIDARKPFEYNVGTFTDSINPNIENYRNPSKSPDFSSFPSYVSLFFRGGYT